MTGTRPAAGGAVPSTRRAGVASSALPSAGLPSAALPSTALPHRVRRVFTDAGVRGWLHALRLDPAPSGHPPAPEVDVSADEPVVMASVYKVPLLVAFCRLIDDGGLDPTERVTVDPAQRTAGPTGLSLIADPVTLSWRDLARSMITVSDNTAADVLLQRVGLDRLRATLTDLDLPRTEVRSGTAQVYRDLVADTATADTAAAFRALSSNDAATDVRAYDVAYGSSTTPREMTRLLAAIWSDAAASPAGCRFARELLGSQVWRDRLRSGFPHEGVAVAGKTGTIGAIRNEMGVVTFRGERPVAVAVFTHAARADAALPRADAAIGQAARLAVAELRSGADE